jgi:hypothetical protein
MSKVSLYTYDDERIEMPERESRGDLLAEYDPSDPESLSRAQMVIQQRFGLTSVPPLCNEPEPGLLVRLWRAIVGLLKGKKGESAQGGVPRIAPLPALSDASVLAAIGDPPASGATGAAASSPG